MKTIHQMFVYHCDDDRCDAIVGRGFEQLPPNWQEIQTGVTTPPSAALEAKHYCPSHHREVSV